MYMNASVRMQCVIVEILAGIAIIVITVLSMTTFQQIMDVFYAATLDAVITTAIIFVAARWVHNRLVTV